MISAAPSPAARSLLRAPCAAAAAPARRASVAAMAAAAKRVLVPVGTGSEEMEAVITIDVLRRAGAEVTVASVETAREVACSRGVVIVADALLTPALAAQPWDLVALPGGMPGAERLRDCAPLVALLTARAAAGAPYAAICATPAVALAPHGLLPARATCHPAFADGFADGGAGAKRVVAEAGVTTSRGPGTAFEFALALVAQLYGPDKAREVAGPMVMHAGAVEGAINGAAAKV
jgi:4-methyl-5(b-hydroxyethyl)-thiazole monophosphate biosynthesis